jgi:aspartyl-tRNA(Asn)/glutamyl-tRNA(Gln) amidotransferase subunit B
VIGLEVHAQLLTASKIFCGCSAAFGAEPNTHTCPICTGMPGSLPVLNRKAVEFAIKLALATGSHVAPFSLFARKNYFYPDLPKGYQISQYELPLSTEGYLEIPVTEGGTKRVGITRIHMEEDAGKLFHDEAKPFSYVDFNRTGVPLLEIVSEPDLRTPQEAADYLRQLRAILQYLEICDGNMEEGSFRCDANVSIRPAGAEKLGTRTEVKNMNSFRHVERALAYEIERQEKVIRGGGAVVQETRLWNPAKGITEAMRGKEEAHDYRYFPDPDLIPVVLDEAWIEAVRKQLPELPDKRRLRFVRDFELSDYDAEILTASRELADYFEEAYRAFGNAKKLANFIGTELLRDYGPERIGACPVQPAQLARLLMMIDEGKISGKIAKTVFAEMLATGHDPEQIVKDKGLTQMSDEGALVALVREIISANPEQLQQYREGKTKVIGFFVGQLMQKTKGQANPQLANQLFQQELNA